MQNFEATHPMTLELAKQKIETAFPALKPVDIKLIGTGFDHTVYEVNNRWVFRFPRREMGYDAMRIEYSVLKELERASFDSAYNIPRVRYYAIADGDNFPFIGLTNIKGNSLMEESDDSILENELANLGTFLRELHDLPLHYFTQGRDELNRLSTEARQESLVQRLEDIRGMIDHELFDITHAYLKEIPLMPNPQGTSLVHGDMHPNNIIMLDGAVHGVIDWGDAHIGHPAIDLSILYQLVSPDKHDPFYKTYGEVDEETKQLAIFKAVSVSIILLHHTTVEPNDNVMRWGKIMLKNALLAWQPAPMELEGDLLAD
ncbi:aminoglycoside phosphotransferase family protein [Paenalkalicoccus suaedae]|uniref:Aminoglycoside phosphotransferase family protein n=1 Tax=Paenalkalicoccus suaedae TaxID=2592382 RepID=A0A859FJG9_9BACI|nr:aminoglycoside phosphotransferase family protein [Paenalkalicoccus suaedae]QKS72950.1 aminoglycoside phosphotransferase family protein [Paenalkalicoccus suaedae]